MKHYQTSKFNDDILKLYQTPLEATRTGPLYNAFSYPTKISPEAIALFIATHTRPNDSILDAFGGSGTTGLAAHLCDIPTEKMVHLCEQKNLKPLWGPRKAHLIEIGVLGSYISDILCNPPDIDTFTEAYKDLLKRGIQEVQWMYRATDPFGEPGVIRHIIWTDFLICPNCSHETSFWESTVTFDPLSIMKTVNCRHCNKTYSTKKYIRATEKFFDPITQTQTTVRKRRMVKVYGQTGKKKWNRLAENDDQMLFNKILQSPIPDNISIKKINWGDLHREGYHTGIKHLHQFYTLRNFLIFSCLWKLTDKYPASINKALKMWLLSYNSSHSTLMTRIVVKKNQANFALTGAQSGVLYISSLPVEKNLLIGLQRKANGFVKAFKTVKGSKSTVTVHNGSSEKLKMGNDTIDYVFTDPPFGDYIPYAELNQINELWLEKVTDRASEIIVSRAQNKTIEQYRNMLSRVFSELYRVLKPGGKVTVVFHSAHTDVWQSLIAAYRKSGFNVRATSILDKIQASFKQVVSTVSVKGDPIILLTKGRQKQEFAISSEQIVTEILNSLNEEAVECNHHKLYSRYISDCLENSLDIKINAKDFHSILETHIVDNAIR